MDAPKKNPDLKRIFTIIACTVVALMLLLIAGVTIYVSHLLGKMNYVTVHTTVSSEEASSIALEEWEQIVPEDSTPVQEDVTVPPPTDGPVEQESHIVNVMLIGQDRRPGQGTQRSDSMIMASFNKSTKKITLISFMRDQYVNIPGYGNDKLCHAYQYGGMKLLDQTLYDHFGVEIHGNIEVDFSGFERIIDRLGGVEIELTEDEAWYMNLGGHWGLTAGRKCLTGEQALVYSRIREIDNDYKRTERQRKVLSYLIEKYKEQDLSTMLSLVEELLPLVTTDIPKDEVVSFAMELFPMLSGCETETLRLPVDGTFKGGYIKVSSSHKMWCQYDIDFEANRQILREIFAP